MSNISYVLGTLLLFVIGIVLIAVMPKASDSFKARIIIYITTIIATFSGVFLAGWLNSVEQTRASRQASLTMLGAALDDAGRLYATTQHDLSEREVWEPEEIASLGLGPAAAITFSDVALKGISPDIRRAFITAVAITQQQHVRLIGVAPNSKAFKGELTKYLADLGYLVALLNIELDMDKQGWSLSDVRKKIIASQSERLKILDAERVDIKK